MKLYIYSFFFLLLGPVLAQEEVDPDRIETPKPGLDFEGCFRDLDFADTNGDGVVKKTEYLGFINEYGKRRCHNQPELTLQQHGAFNSLACVCKQRENASPDCCIDTNAEILTAGATSPSSRTEEELQYLRNVCTTTDATISGECPPVIKERGDPLPIIFTPVSPASSGLSDRNMWLIIAAAILMLLILCCCCCCVIRRKRAKALEEEEEEMTKARELEMAEDGAGGPGAMGGAVAAVPPGGRGGAAATADDDSSEYSYDGEGRKKRGTNFGESEEEKLRRKFGGAGPLPSDPNNPENVVLRPFDKEEHSDPDWDHVGRDINFPKPDPDEMSAQEFDPYNPDGGVYDPKRPGKAPVGPPKISWERLKKDEPDEIDDRKHRIQSGLGPGEVWNALDTPEEKTKSKGGVGDMFDWVVQSALGVLDKSDEHGHFDASESENNA